VHVNNPIPKVSGNRISRFDFTATVNLKPTSDPKPMEQIKPNYFGGANFEARTVKDIIEPAKSISNKISVRAALDQMQAQATDSSPVVDQCGELLGILSKNKMNRNVGGFGHDPKTELVEAHIEKNNAYCFEDQTIAEAEQMMLNAKLGEVFVVTREKLLVGTINIEAIAQEGKKMESRLHPTSSPI
jgi:signal-transduction protein with cAMP-binding, CBS, and nucleotidyltransferase domain